MIAYAKEVDINLQRMVAVGHGHQGEQRPDGDQDADVQPVPKQDQAHQYLQGVWVLPAGQNKS